ncbi:MAG: sel1 repeat family protein [Candidatus Obscuribacterales bacterium]|jgi:TPR repeat protein|nr:sel1 repeat family protein [Candidatus Obscuribacterales bacterium]
MTNQATSGFPLMRQLVQPLFLSLLMLVLSACASERLQNPENFDLYNYLVQTDGISSRAAAAIPFLKEEAEKGSYEAQYKLGVYYYIGSGVTQNFKESFKWFKKAADQADETDMRPEFVVGVLYAKGQGTQQSMKDAFTWFRIASQSKDQEGESARQFLQWIKKEQASSK